MATTEELQEILAESPIEVVAKNENSFLLRCAGIDVLLPEPEVDDFLSIRAAIETPHETAFFTARHFEQVIELGRAVGPPSRLFREDAEGQKLESQEHGMTLEISLPTSRFLLSNLAQRRFRALRRSIMMARHRLAESSQPQTFQALFSRYLTVQVREVSDRPASTRAKLEAVAHSGVFHYSYGAGFAINLPKEWERPYYRRARRRRESVQFPKRTYHPELLSYYQLALSSDSLVLGFLALYKILEFYFSSASEKQLHRAMADKLVLPDFSHTKPRQLRELAATVRRYDQKMDERRMLASVIEEHFKVEELGDWADKLDPEIRAYFTSPQLLFGDSFTLDFNPHQFASSIASRIYHVRNAIVHNKEAENARFVPFSGQENALYREAPLILFLAEQLIIKTGKELT